MASNCGYVEITHCVTGCESSLLLSFYNYATTSFIPTIVGELASPRGFWWWPLRGPQFHRRFSLDACSDKDPTRAVFGLREDRAARARGACSNPTSRAGFGDSPCCIRVPRGLTTIALKPCRKRVVIFKNMNTADGALCPAWGLAFFRWTYQQATNRSFT